MTVTASFPTLGLGFVSMDCIRYVSLVSFHLEPFLILTFSFMTLMILKSIGKYFCRMHLNLDLSFVSLYCV